MGRLEATADELKARRFREIMGRLNGLKFAPAQLDTHWLGLQDLPLADLDAAVDRAARELTEFPSPKMLRAYISDRRDQQQQAQMQQRSDRSTIVEPKTIQALVPIIVQREWHYYCDDCSDSGWLNHWCGSEVSPKPWVTRRACERKREHGSHEWVRLCPCVERNPDVPATVKQRARTREHDHA